jgi:hypothetical protein
MTTAASLSVIPSTAIEKWNNGTTWNYIEPADAYAAAPTTPKSTITQLFSGSVAVPSDFFGLHINASAAPTVGAASCGWVRTHDCGVHWPQIETAAGVYDWSGLDALLSHGRGARLVGLSHACITPSFYASDLTKFDQYGRQGASSNPDCDWMGELCDRMCAAVRDAHCGV